MPDLAKLAAGGADTAPSRDHPSRLRGYIQQESIPVPKDLMVRSRIVTVIYTSFPYMLIALTAFIPGFGILEPPASIIVAFLLLLAAQRLLQTMVHDLSHGLFSGNRAFNDALGNLFVAGLIGMRIQNYWNIHRRHHAANGSADDPEFVDFKIVRESGGLGLFVIKYALGLEAIGLIRKYYFSREQKRRSSGADTGAERDGDRIYIIRLLRENLHIVVGQLFLMSIFVFVVQAWYIYLLWLYVALTWSPMLSKLRFLVEHPGRADLTVSTRAPFWERLYFAPYNFNYHFEHHLWPALPPYNLKRAHRHLSETGYYERHPEYLNHSFVAALFRQSAA